MQSAFVFFDSVVTLMIWAVILSAVFSWLIGFNIINIQMMIPFFKITILPYFKNASSINIICIVSIKSIMASIMSWFWI